MKKTALHNALHSRVTYWVVLGLTAALLAGTAIDKGLNHHIFAIQLKLVPFAPVKWAAPVLSKAVPAIHALLVIGLFIECLPRIGAVRQRAIRAAAGLFSVYALYITGMLIAYTKAELPCTCGGIHTALGWWLQLSINVILALGCYQAWRIGRRRPHTALVHAPNHSIHLLIN